MQDTLSAVHAAKSYYGRLRSDEEFDCFFSKAVSAANEHRCKRRPSQIEDGSVPLVYYAINKYYFHRILEKH